MTSSGSVYSEVLRDISTTKLEELAKKRAVFEQKNSSVANTVQQTQDTIQALSVLSDGVKSCLNVGIKKDGRIIRGSTNNPRLEIDLRNIDRLLEQARNDPSVSLKTLGRWREILVGHLQRQSARYEYADLYGKLIEEWLASREIDSSNSAGDDINMDDYEQVQGKKKLVSISAWEESVFTTVEVDQSALNTYLEGIFMSKAADRKSTAKALHTLRDKVSSFEATLASPNQIDQYKLKKAISDLISSDLLTQEKRSVLRDFRRNHVVLSEIVDVLNLRLAAIQTWSWGKDVAVEARRQLNGTYNIYMHEDILQAILLQFIGVKWSVFFKEAFNTFCGSEEVWELPAQSIPSTAQKRRAHYLGGVSTYPNVQSQRMRTWHKAYFLSGLIDFEGQEISTNEGEEEADFEEMAVQQPNQQPSQYRQRTRAKQSARKSTGGQAPMMAKLSRPSGQSEDGSDASSEERLNLFGKDDTESMKNPIAAKQALLHHLTTDLLLKTRLDGSFTCFRAQFDSWNPTLPHKTILSVLSFLGVSETWLDVFKRFLQAPLRLVDQNSEAKLRQTGTPGSHVLTDVFGEVVRFCLDFSVNQVTQGTPLWRINEDFWFWSENHETCVRAWSAVEKFCKIMHVSINDAKSGTVHLTYDNKRKAIEPARIEPSLPTGQIRWGMLYLNPSSGRFEIDQHMVDTHIDDLCKQLKEKERSILSWIQVWNVYATNFFTTNFGKPAGCFGVEHVDMMLQTHERIQNKIFEKSTTSDETHGSVVQFLKNEFRKRFRIDDIPDGFFYLPTCLGGLEVRSPFIPLVQLRSGFDFHGQPSELISDFLEEETESYNTARISFEKDGPSHYAHRSNFSKSNRPDYIPESEDFLPFDEYVQYRETINHPNTYKPSNSLATVYKSLLAAPTPQDPEDPTESVSLSPIKPALNALVSRPNLKGVTSSWYNMEPYWKWVVSMFGEEIIEKFGSLGIVEPEVLPLGMVEEIKEGKLGWGE